MIPPLACVCLLDRSRSGGSSVGFEFPRTLLGLELPTKVSSWTLVPCELLLT